VYWAGGECTNLVEERSPMKREVEFAGSFGMSVLLLAGSFAVAQSATTAKAKKPSAATTTAAASATAQSAVPTTNAQATPAASGQTSGAAATTATTTTKPKTMVSADKRTIPVPQI
jgi:hypothetical protein